MKGQGLMSMRLAALTVFMHFGSLAAQDSTNRVWIGVDYSAGTNFYTDILGMLDLTLTTGKHQVNAGPLLMGFTTTQSSRPLIGGHLGYRIYPNERHRRFNLLFSYDLHYSNNSSEETIDLAGLAPQSMHKITTSWLLFSHHISYGFRWNIVRVLYMHTSVGIGALKWQRDILYEFADGTSRAVPDRRAWEASVLIRLGMGLEFPSKLVMGRRRDRK